LTRSFASRLELRFLISVKVFVAFGESSWIPHKFGKLRNYNWRYFLSCIHVQVLPLALELLPSLHYSAINPLMYIFLGQDFRRRWNGCKSRVKKYSILISFLKNFRYEQNWQNIRIRVWWVENENRRNFQKIREAERSFQI